MASSWSVSARKIVAAAAVLPLLLPPTTWALTTSPAALSTISLSGTGNPKCTTLKYHLKQTAGRIILWIGKDETGHTGSRIWRMRKDGVPAGDRSFRWCGTTLQGAPLGPGVLFWHVVRRSADGRRVLSTSGWRRVWVVS